MTEKNNKKLIVESDANARVVTNSSIVIDRRMNQVVKSTFNDVQAACLDLQASINGKVDKLATAPVLTGSFGASKTITLASFNADGQFISGTVDNIAISTSQITDAGNAGGCATLDSNGKVPSTQLPDGVEEELGEIDPTTDPLPTNKPSRPGDFYLIIAVGSITIGGVSVNVNIGDKLYSPDGTNWAIKPNASLAGKVDKINITGGSVVTDASKTPQLTINNQGQVTVFNEIDIAISTSQITDAGNAGGCATLDSNGKTPSTQLPDGVENQIGTLTPTQPLPTKNPSRPGDFYLIIQSGFITIGGVTVNINIGDKLFSPDGSSWMINYNASKVPSYVFLSDPTSIGKNQYYTLITLSASATVSLPAGSAAIDGIRYDIAYSMTSPVSNSILTLQDGSNKIDGASTINLNRGSSVILTWCQAETQWRVIR